VHFLRDLVTALPKHEAPAMLALVKTIFAQPNQEAAKAAVAEMERELIRERVRAGMVRARAQGNRLGRPRRSMPVSQHRMWSTVVEGMAAGHLSRAEAARKLRVRRATLDQALRAGPNGGAAPVAVAEIGRGG